MPLMGDGDRRQVSIGAITGIVVTLLLVVLAVQNSGQVEVDVLFWSGELRLIFVIIGSAILGMVVGAVVRHRMRRD